MPSGKGIFESKILLTAKNTAGAAFKKLEGQMSGLGPKLATVGKSAALAGAAVAAAFGASTVRNITNYGRSLGDLSAITGATGAQLEQLSDAAKRVGATTTLSASQAAEAFKLVASAKPDLLANNDALIATTESAVLLAEASGIELPTAAKALGESLNQFSLGAESAAMAVDVLAVASQQGAAEVSEVNEALRNAGTTAKLSGVSFQDTVAAIEAMAKQGSKGSRAGTQLRQALVALTTQTNDQWNPSVVGISAALKNFEEANVSVTDKVKLFGKEGMQGIDILLAQREEFERLRGEMNKQGVAAEQARARYDNLNGDLLQMKSVYEALTLEVGGQFEPLLREVVQLVTALIGVMVQASDGTEEVTDKFGLLSGTLRTVFSAITIITASVEQLISAMSFAGDVLKAIFTGNFSEIPDLVVGYFEEAVDRVKDTASTVGAMWDENIKENVRAGFEANVAAPTLEGLDQLNQDIAAAIATAGEIAAAEEQEKMIEKMTSDLDRLREFLASEREIIDTERAERNEVLTEAWENGLLQEDEFRRLSLESEAKYQADITKLQNKGLTDRQKFEKKKGSEKLKQVFGDMATMTAGAAQHNKTLFKINKMAAIAEAVVAMPAHISTTMSKYPYPISIAMGALAAASSLAQIQAIKSTSFSGSGGGTTPSAAGSVPVINNQAVPSLADETTGRIGEGDVRRIDLNIDADEGTVFSANQVRQLIEDMGEALGDGVRLNVSGA